MQRIARFGTLLVILALVCAGPAAAQNTSGAITGTITDTQGGVLPGVTLTVTNAETGVARTAITEADGRWTLTEVGAQFLAEHGVDELMEKWGSL